MRVAILSLVSACVLVVGCQPASVAPTATRSTLTTGQVKSKLLINTTSQAEVVRLLGSPNMVLTKAGDSSGPAEVWTYDQISMLREDVEGEAGALVLGGGISPRNNIAGAAGIGGMASGGSRATSVRTATLILEFGKDGVLKHYEMMTTAF